MREGGREGGEGGKERANGCVLCSPVSYNQKNSPLKKKKVIAKDYDSTN